MKRLLLLALVLSGCGTRSAACTADTDCRLIEDYCACQCRAGHVSDPNPTCADPCQTFAPLCQGQLSPICVSGACIRR